MGRCRGLRTLSSFGLCRASDFVELRWLGVAKLPSLSRSFSLGE